MTKELDTLWNNFINNTWQSMSVVPDTINTINPTKEWK